MRSVVSRYATAVAVAAVVAASATSALVPLPELTGVDVAVLVALTATLVAAAARPVHLGAGSAADGATAADDPGTEAASHHAMTLEEAVLLAMVVVVPVGALPWLVLLAVTLEQAHRRAPGVKAAFNVGTAGLGAAAAVAVVLRLRAVLDVDDVLVELGAAAFAVVVGAGVQLLLVAQLRRLLAGGPLRGHLTLVGFLDVTLVLNVLLGVVLAAAILLQPWMAAVALGLVVTLGGLLRGQAPTASGHERSPSVHGVAP